MSQTATPTFASATNFDLPSLHILLAEIEVALKDAEVHLSEFHDDEEQVSLLMDSATVIEQLAAIFDLISFKGASELAYAVAKNLKKLHASGDNEDKPLIMDISEGIMLLDRYVEFVLLKEVLEPSLLLPIINKLHAHLGEPTLTSEQLATTTSISITNPEQHYQAPAQLGLNMPQLIAAYRAGLGVALSKTDANLSADEINKLQMMHQSCQEIANRSDTLFWQAAVAVTANLANNLPLNNIKKRVLIYLEQQFQAYLPIHDRRFADLVSFACEHNQDFIALARQKYALGRPNESQYKQMYRFLFGPNREITDTLNLLIQSEINTIKEKVDGFVRGDTGINNLSAIEISEQIKQLSATMKILSLDEAANALHVASSQLASWTTPTPEDFDNLLTELMVAENAAIFLAKTHTPGVVKLPLHNRTISLHQLDTAYDTLIKESRANIATISQAINDYLADNSRDLLHLQNMPEALQQVAGAASFLRLPISSKMFTTLSRYLTEYVVENRQGLSDQTLADIADVIVAVDYQLEGQEENRPVNKQSLVIGQYSLSRVLSA